MTPEKISLTVNLRGLILVFFFNMLSIEDEQAYMDRLQSVPDGPDKRDKEYQILIDGVAAWSYQMPRVRTYENDQMTEKELGEGAIADEIRNFFKDRTPSNERILNTLIIKFREAMTPTVSFL